MDTLLIPVLILVLVAAGVLLAIRAWNHRSEHPMPTAPAADPDTAGLAHAAAARLNQEQHRQLYALIAQGQAMAAIKVYLEATGEGLRASRDAVAALAEHPQPFRAPEAAPEAVAEEDETPQRFPYRYRAIASKGDVTREVSSNMLNDEIYGRIRTLAKSGDPEAAAPALTRHSDISMKQAREFIALLDD